MGIGVDMSTRGRKVKELNFLIFQGTSKLLTRFIEGMMRIHNESLALV